MKINWDYFEKIKPILRKLCRKVEGDFVVFGSAPLYLFGALKFEGLGNMHDLDILLDGHVKNSAIEKTVYFENDKNQKLYKLSIDGVNIDVGTLWPGHEEWFEKVFENSQEINGYKFASLETVLEWKKRNIKKYDRKKDKEAIARIKKFLPTYGTG
ncbi:MAG: hypothetical protein U9M98_02540 [Patescibacteria group bacterium]|nr:hypothetical protein [Patescibacteria group bacterium]